MFKHTQHTHISPHHCLLTYLYLAAPERYLEGENARVKR